MATAPSSLLYYFTPAYISNLVFTAFNKQMGTNHNPANYLIQQIPNDQNSRCAYEFYAKDANNLLRIRIYCQLDQHFSLSPFSVQDVSGDYNSETATLNTGYYSLPVTVSFGGVISQDASLIKNVYKADFKIGQQAYAQYSLSYPNQCPPYANYGNDVWVLGSKIDNQLITDQNGNVLVIHTD